MYSVCEFSVHLTDYTVVLSFFFFVFVVVFFVFFFFFFLFFLLMIRRPPRSTLDRSSAASDVYKRQPQAEALDDCSHFAVKEQIIAAPVTSAEVLSRSRWFNGTRRLPDGKRSQGGRGQSGFCPAPYLSLIHISEPTRPY